MLFVLALADYWLPNGNVLKDYVRGIFTETIGIIATLIFVEYIFSKHEEKSAKKEEVDSIKRSHKVLNAYIQRFEQYAYQVVTPVTNRNPAQYRSVPNDFRISDMRDLFFPSLLMHDGQEPVVLACIKSQQELKRCIEDFVRTIDFQYYPELSGLFLEYLDAVGVVNLLDGISFHCTATMGDGQKQQMLKNFIAELLRDHRGPAEYLPNSIINTYIALYNLIKYNVVFIEQYRCLVQNILGENIYNNEHN